MFVLIFLLVEKLISSRCAQCFVDVGLVSTAVFLQQFRCVLCVCFYDDGLSWFAAFSL